MNLLIRVAAVSVLEVDKVVLFFKVCIDVFKTSNSDLSSPNAEMEALFSSIFLFIRSFLVLFQHLQGFQQFV